eukprot:9496838-Alexandrium_andersonii.AAC.1
MPSASAGPHLGRSQTTQPSDFPIGTEPCAGDPGQRKSARSGSLRRCGHVLGAPFPSSCLAPGC